MNIATNTDGLPPSYQAGTIVVSADHTNVWKETGRFGGWPANHGIWSWGNEIVVGFSMGYFKRAKGGHNVDGSKPSTSGQSRSADGGLTWSAPVEFKPLPPTSLDNIDFTAPGFAMTVRPEHQSRGFSKFYISPDKAATWHGPYEFTPFGLKFMAGRTDYIINGPRDMLAFLSGADASTTPGEGRVFCARTRDGGKTWTFEGWVTPNPPNPGWFIMPSTVKLPDGSLVCAVRAWTKISGKGKAWIQVYSSRDGGKTWDLLGDATEHLGGFGNPPALLRLKDGRLALSYGYRMAPSGIRARLSTDNGKTWGKEIILRDDGACFDLGYCRAVQRPDGKICTVYYHNAAKSEAEMTEVFIGATVWDPGPLGQ